MAIAPSYLPQCLVAHWFKLLSKRVVMPADAQAAESVINEVTWSQPPNWSSMSIKGKKSSIHTI